MDLIHLSKGSIFLFLEVQGFSHQFPQYGGIGACSHYCEGFELCRLVVIASEESLLLLYGNPHSLSIKGENVISLAWLVLHLVLLTGKFVKLGSLPFMRLLFSALTCKFSHFAFKVVVTVQKISDYFVQIITAFKGDLAEEGLLELVVGIHERIVGLLEDKAEERGYEEVLEDNVELSRVV